MLSKWALRSSGVRVDMQKDCLQHINPRSLHVLYMHIIITREELMAD